MPLFRRHLGRRVHDTFFGLIIAYTLLAVLEQRDVGDYDARDAATYAWLAQGMLMTIYLWGWFEVALRVRSGDVATDLQRPLDFQLYWLAQDLGRALYHGLFRGVPPFVIGALLFDVLIPDDPLVWLALRRASSSRSLRASRIASCSTSRPSGCSTIEARECSPIYAFLMFLSGQVVPIALFPEWLCAPSLGASLRRHGASADRGLARARPGPRAGRAAGTTSLLGGRLARRAGSCCRRACESWSSRVAETLGIYRRLVAARVRAQLQYRLSFALTVVGNMFLMALDFVAILVLFGQVDALGDWTASEVALLYGISTVSFALTDLAIGQLDQLPRMIREGDFAPRFPPGLPARSARS